MTTSFELILDDTSPVINYYPFAETLGAPNLVAGWNSYFSNSGFLSVLGETGNGTSMHVTSLDGAELTIQWFGTGIALFGQVFKAAYNISVDGVVQSIGLPQGDLLVEVQGLQPTQHIIALVAHPSVGSTSVNPSSYVAFDRAAFNVSTNFTGATVSTQTISTRDNRWVFSGDWTQLSDPVLSSEPSQDYHLSTTQGSTASISFLASAVTVTGIRNTTVGHYNVTLDGTTTTFNGQSDWLEPSTLFLQAGLDELSEHNLTITNVDDASLAIAGLNLTALSGGTFLSNGSSADISMGTVIALVLAGLVALSAISTLFIGMYIRRHRTRDRKPSFSIEPGATTRAFITTSSQKRRDSRHGRYQLTRASGEAEQDRGYSNTPETEEDSIVLIAPSQSITPGDPASPMPYLRQPSSASHEQKEIRSLQRQEKDRGFGRNSQQEQGGRGRLGLHVSRMSSLETVVPGPLAAHSLSDSSPTYPGPDDDVLGHWSGKRRESVDLSTSQILYLDIPSPNIDMDIMNPTAVVPAMPTKKRSSVQFAASTYGGDHHTSWRSLPRTGHRTLSSISTMQFGRRPRSEDSGMTLSAEQSELSLWKDRPAGNPV